MVICLSCDLTLTKAFTQPVKSSDSYTIAQLFPTFKNVTLWNKCVLTCRMQDSGHGGILALRAKTFSIDGTSVISTTGLGRLHIMLNCNLMEGEEVTQQLIVMMAQVEEEAVDIFLVVGVVVPELVVAVREVQEEQLQQL